jgi:FlaA1/EpsC-like NDP-sugar epimerase
MATPCLHDVIDMVVAMLLKGKTAIIFGAGGAIGSAVAKAFAAKAPGSS